VVGCPRVVDFVAFMTEPTFNCIVSNYLCSLLIIAFVMLALANLLGIQPCLVLGLMNLTPITLGGQFSTI
jgi:cadmium resistance protein CadD (predicted permease)